MKESTSKKSYFLGARVSEKIYNEVMRFIETDGNLNKSSFVETAIVEHMRRLRNEQKPEPLAA